EKAPPSRPLSPRWPMRVSVSSSSCAPQRRRKISPLNGSKSVTFKSASEVIASFRIDLALNANECPRSYGSRRVAASAPHHEDRYDRARIDLILRRPPKAGGWKERLFTAKKRCH